SSVAWGSAPVSSTAATRARGSASRRRAGARRRSASPGTTASTAGTSAARSALSRRSRGSGGRFRPCAPRSPERGAIAPTFVVAFDARPRAVRVVSEFRPAPCRGFATPARAVRTRAPRPASEEVAMTHGGGWVRAVVSASALVAARGAADAAILYLGLPGGTSSAYVTLGANAGWTRLAAADLPRVGFGAAPALADLDGGGDADALVGDSTGHVVAFEN